MKRRDKTTSSSATHHTHVLKKKDKNENNNTEYDNIKKEREEELSLLEQIEKQIPNDFEIYMKSRGGTVDVRLMMDKMVGGSLRAGNQIRDVSTVTLFLSSTFDDTLGERNYLMEYVYPRLSEFCRGVELEFSVVDLRWGIGNESTDNHKTIDVS